MIRCPALHDPANHHTQCFRDANHDTSTESGDDCVCVPTPQFVDGGELIVHHSLDGRELHEQTR